MKTILILFLSLALAFSVFSQATVSSSNEKTVRIGAFNVQIFGLSKAKKTNVLTVLAEIASTYDVLALEEVGNNASTATDETCTEVMDEYVSRINKVVGSDEYTYCRGNQYGIVYKKSEFTLVGSSLYSGSQTFTYQPLTAYFKSKEGNFNFTMLVIHTSPSKAKSEIPELKIAMAEVSSEYKELDVICLGDFNGDGNYYTEGTGTNLAGFDSSTYISAIPNSYDTTVATSSNTYDRIELSSSMKSDFDGKSGVFEFGKVFDVSQCEGTAKTAGTESAVSDHYPVWAEFYLDRDTD
jgi:endonuclease/exonuclease/phosphatase family metal-dependent hydrolase